MSLIIRASLTALVALCGTALLTAASPVFWTVSTQADFLKGSVAGIAVDADGGIRLGPAIEPLADPQQPFVWSLARAGNDWLAGTGNDGHVLRIAPDGTTAVAFDAAELSVHALLVDGQGGFYAATGPDGRVHRVPASGPPAVVFDPVDKYIWALARADDGTLYVGTGDHGVIYRVRPDGTSGVFYQTRAANVISLAVADDGTLYAGTSAPARLFRIDPAGRAFVVIDSPHKEIRALRAGSDGVLYAAAITPDSDDNAADAGPVASVTAQVSGVAVGAAAGESHAASPPDSRRTGRGTVYAVRDRMADVIWETGTDTPYDLLPTSDGQRLMVATAGAGAQGRVYELDLRASPVRATLLGRIDARHVTQLAAFEGGDLVAAASNPGRLMRLRSGQGLTGTFESEVRDAGSAARWGSIRWRASGAGRIQISSRSGNTDRPDDTWSEWSPAYAVSDGSPIVSPAARYLQWRAVLEGSNGGGPVLTSVTVAYLPRNLRPAVVSLTVQPPGVVFQRPFSSNDTEIAGFDAGVPAQELDAPTDGSPAVGRRMYRKGLQTFQWRAEDPNNDRLTYVVSARREGEAVWRTLAETLSDPIYVWDTTSVADGRYVIRVAASDAAVNAPADALQGVRESDSFDVDNSAPVIDLAPAAGAPATVRVVVRDAQSGVQRVEYAIGGEAWRVVYPVDGLSDSREEVYTIVLPSAADRARLVIRATDVLQNVATLAAGR